MIRLAAIDIGTNSTKMIVADVGDDGHLTVIAEDSDVTRLGEGVDQAKFLSAAAISRTLEAVSRFAEAALRLGAVQTLGAGTSALRDAANGSDFIDQVRTRTGVRIEIITGDREAQLAYAAVRSDAALSLPADSSLLVFDIGGGSTELILGDGQGVGYYRSLDVGAVRLTERFLTRDPPDAGELAVARRFIDESLSSFAAPSSTPMVVGIGGTAVNLAAMTQGREETDPVSLHGVLLTAVEVKTALQRLCAVPLAERRLIPGLEPKRADVIVAGGLVLDRLLAHFGADRSVVSVRGLRYGLLSDHVQAGR